jgi:hypothetical protein
MDVEETRSVSEPKKQSKRKSKILEVEENT